MRTFAIRLKESRLEQNLSQADLAERLNVSQSIIARWESDECEPTVTNIIAIANIFNISADYLIGRINDEDYGKI